MSTVARSRSSAGLTRNTAIALKVLTTSSTATSTQARGHATVPAATNKTIATITASAMTRVSTLNIGPA